jgi:Na+-transporting methylmalonyl-CoA/oxaloacetate decarboxylase gamma subunit
MTHLLLLLLLSLLACRMNGVGALWSACYASQHPAASSSSKQMAAQKQQMQQLLMMQRETTSLIRCCL